MRVYKRCVLLKNHLVQWNKIFTEGELEES